MQGVDGAADPGGVPSACRQELPALLDRPAQHTGLKQLQRHLHLVDLELESLQVALLEGLLEVLLALPGVLEGERAQLQQRLRIALGQSVELLQAEPRRGAGSLHRHFRLALCLFPEHLRAGGCGRGHGT